MNLDKKNEILEEGALKDYTYDMLSFAVSETIVNYRKKNNLTQKQFATVLGMSQERVSRLEYGINISLKNLCEINEKLENKDYSFILDVIFNMKRRAEALFNKSYYINVEVDSNVGTIEENSIKYKESKNCISFDSYMSTFSVEQGSFQKVS